MRQKCRAPKSGPGDICRVDLVTTATTAAAAATTATATAAAAAATIFTRTGNIHSQAATIKIFTVQAFDSRVGFVFGAHGDETEATRATGFTIHQEGRFDDLPELGEGVFELGFGRAECNVSDKQFVIHVIFDFPPMIATCLSLFPTVGFQIITEQPKST